MSRKKLAVVINDITTMGGVQKICSVLCSEFVRMYDVTIVSLGKTNESFYYDFPNDIKVIYTIRESVRIRQLLADSRKNLRKVLKKNKYDCVLSLGVIAGFITSLANIGIGRYHVFADHGALCNQLDDKKATFFRKVTAKCADRIVSLTKTTENDYHEIFKTTKDKLLTIPNPIEDSFLKRDITYNPQNGTVLSVTRFSEEKGIDLLLKIAKKAVSIEPDLKWKVYGDGSEFDFYKEQIEKENLDKNILLMGSATDLQPVYEDAAVFALTSYREGLPVVLLESLAKCLPMISFDVKTGANEIIANGENGLLVPCYDTELFAVKMVDLLRDSKRLEEMSLNCREYKSKFLLCHVVEMWDDVISRGGK